MSAGLKSKKNIGLPEGMRWSQGKQMFFLVKRMQDPDGGTEKSVPIVLSEKHGHDKLAFKGRLSWKVRWPPDENSVFL